MAPIARKPTAAAGAVSGGGMSWFLVYTVACLHAHACIQSHTVACLPRHHLQSLSAGALPGARHLAAYNHPSPASMASRSLCVCAHCTRPHHWHTCRSGALGGLGGGGVGGGSENPARPFPPRRRTVAASVAASVAAWPIEFNPRLSIDLSSSDAPKELFPKGQVALTAVNLRLHSLGTGPGLFTPEIPSRAC